MDFQCIQSLRRKLFNFFSPDGLIPINVGIEPGSLVITEEAVDGLLRPYMEMVSFFYFNGYQTY